MGKYLSRAWAMRSSNRSRIHRGDSNDSKSISKTNDEEGKAKELP